MGRMGKRKGYRPRTQQQQRQEAAALAAEQASAAHQKKIYRVVALATAVLLAVALFFGIAMLVQRCTGDTALATAHCRIDSEMFRYYFYEHYLAALEENEADYIAAGLDPQKSLAEQEYEEGITWEQHFLTEVKDALRRMLVFAETAYREGAVDQSAAAATADERLAAIATVAADAGYTTADYLAARYGSGEAAVRRALTLSAIAEKRYAAFTANTYTAAERAAKYEQDPTAYYVSNVLTYTIKVDLSMLEGEAETRAEFLRAETRAKQIAAAGSESAFLAAAEADLLAEDPHLSARALAEALDAMYVYHIPTAAQGLVAQWVNTDGRQTGDTAVLGATGDYTVVFCLAAPHPSTVHRVSAQYAYFPYQSYMTEAQAAAAAEALLLDFRSGGQSSASFATLAEAYATADGNRFASVTYGDVERPLCTWLMDEGREAGDTVVLAGHTGYYVLYFEGRSSLPLWEELVVDALQEEEYRTLLAAGNVTVYESGCVLPSFVPAL